MSEYVLTIKKGNRHESKNYLIGGIIAKNLCCNGS